MDIHELLSELTDAARDNRDKGDLFERLVASYLMSEPRWAELFEDVWLWSDWPDRWSADVGIDLVMRERLTGDYWAGQCKFYAPEHHIQRSDIDTFFTASGRSFATTEGERGFARRLVVATTDKWGSHAEEALTAQTIPVHCGLSVDIRRFQEIDWRERFDGIWACASSLHVPMAELTEVLQRLSQALRPDSVLYASFKYGRGEREHRGRRFTDLDEPGLVLMETWLTEDRRVGREEARWLNVLLKS